MMRNVNSLDHPTSGLESETLGMGPSTPNANKMVLMLAQA